MILLSKCLYKLLISSIDIQEFLSLSRFKINTLNTRDSDQFYLVFSNTNYFLNSPVNLLMVVANLYVFDCISYCLYYIFLIYF